jgi:hypothetical protein
MRFFVIFLVLAAIGCESAMLKHAKAKYPENCTVEEVDEVTVKVSCPGQEPFERRFKKTR